MAYLSDTDFLDKSQLFLVRALRVTLFIAIIIEVLNKRWALLFATSLILLFTFVPYFIEKRYRLSIPIEYELIIIAFIYASLFLGEMQDYYVTFWWWDALLHASSGLALGFAGFVLLYVLYHKNKIGTKPFWMAFFAFCFALSMGAVWEIFEFILDSLLEMNMQRRETGVVDTMIDLIIDSLGALITSTIGYYYFKGKKAPLFNRLMLKFKKENPHLFK